MVAMSATWSTSCTTASYCSPLASFTRTRRRFATTCALVTMSPSGDTRKPEPLEMGTSRPEKGCLQGGHGSGRGGRDPERTGGQAGARQMGWPRRLKVGIVRMSGQQHHGEAPPLSLESAAGNPQQEPEPAHNTQVGAHGDKGRGDAREWQWRHFGRSSEVGQRAVTCPDTPSLASERWQPCRGDGHVLRQAEGHSAPQALVPMGHISHPDLCGTAQC